MDLGLDGRVYLLTGASRGLGFATARCLVADGANVVVSARDPERVTSAAEALTAAASGGARAIGIALDNTDPDAPNRLIGTAIERFGRFDGGLISVGGPTKGTAAGVTDEQWREAFETVFLGAVRLARAMTTKLTEGTSGTGAGPDRAIGFVLSSSVRVPIAGLGLSNGLRPGLAGVAKDMADEFGPRGIRVFSLMPGSVYTDRLRELHEASGDPAGAAAAAEATIPLRRFGTPEEFGRVAAFALSPAASYLTGLTIPVDGGALRGI